MEDVPTMDDSLEGIAVIGMAGRFPGAPNVEAFWRNLRDGIDAVVRFSDAQLLEAGVDPALLADPNYVKAGPVLDDIELFDAELFGFSAREAELTDPQHRLFLECAWEALEHAGHDPDRYPGRVGVFAGAGLNTYLFQIMADRDVFNSPDAFQAMISNDKDYLATRVSYKLNLRGPSVTIQTACSTSLVAVHLACQSLLNYQADMALAGGVSIAIPQRAGYLYQEGMIFSPDGRCRAFDAAARGTVGGSGAGIVVLKRLAEALADGDTVYAVIRGSAINNDGAAKVGYTAPSEAGQAEAIADALAVAGIDPATLSYVEAHGTGTPLGDPIELAALRRVYGAGRGPGTCALGSVKSNVGHLDAAAGVTGLIKTALALHHRELPASLHYERPNPRLELDGSPFYVNAALTAWPEGDTPRRAAVSSFGLGGTNAHVVLEEAPLREPSLPSSRRQLLTLSARSASALDALRRRLAGHLRAHPDQDLADVAYTLQVGRKPLSHRRVVICRDREDAAVVLDGGDPTRALSRAGAGSDPSVVFMFPGGGAQYPNMGRELYEAEPLYREQVDNCLRLVEPHLDVELRRLMFPEDVDREAAARELERPSAALPALFIAEYALAKLWMSWGIEPAAMTGHSMGEYTAACLAEVMSLEDALSLVALRGRLFETLPEGAMLSVRCSEEQLQPLLSQELSLAAINAPNLCVASGPVASIGRLEQALAAHGIEHQRLRISVAAHSGMLEPILEEFGRRVATFRLRPPTRRWVSNLSGTWITPEEATDPSYWVRHLRGAVRFSAGLRELLKDPNRLFLEVGPGQTLSALVRQHLSDQAAQNTVISSTRHPREVISDVEFILASLGRLWLAGASPDWSALHADRPPRRVQLPAYPFERRRYWIGSAAPSRAANGAAATVADEAANADPRPEPTDSAHPRPELATAYVAPRDGLERAVAEVWQELLGIESIGVHDNFLELGGHSLLATQLIARLRVELAVDLSLQSVFEAPTVAALAELVRARRPAQDGPAPGAPIVPVPRGEPLPLSFAQQRLWLIDQLEPGNVAYNVPFALSIAGRLDVSALERSLNEIARRHEVLRTTFAVVDGQPVQVIVPASELELPIVDLRGVPAAEREAEARRQAIEEARRPFDLARGPLLRVGLLHLADEEYVLLLTMHHIVSDGWSLGVLAGELAALYEAYAAGRAASLPELPIQYADFAVWQREWLQGAVLEQQQDYWKRRLEGAPALLELPTDRPRPAVQSTRGATYTFELPPTLSEAIQALSQREGVTPFMTLLAAFKTLLHRYTGQEDLVVGSPIANRTRAETEGLIGFFVNTLALRTDLGGDPTFRELLERIRGVTLGAYDHQDLPFEQLVEALQPERTLSHSPIFQVMFVLQNAWSLELAGLQSSELAVDSGVSQFDLTLAMWEGERGLTASLEYSIDLFDPATISQMAGHLRRLLEAIVADPGRRLSELPLLTEPERQQLAVWNASRAEYPDTAVLHQLVEAQVERTPDAIAVRSGDRQLSYRELNERANRLAHYLRGLGIGPDVLVGLCVERSPDLLVALLGVLKAGGAYVPLDPSYPHERLAFMVTDADPPVLLTQQSLLGRLPETIARVVCLDADWDVIALEAPTNPVPSATPDNAAYVIYTSGSTGRPKGVLVPHRGTVNHASAIIRHFDIRASDRVLQFASIGFDAAAEEIYPTWLVGATLVLRPDQALATYDDFLRFVESESLTVLDLPTAYWHEWVRELAGSGAPLPASLRLVIVGGEKALPERVATWRELAGNRVRWSDTYGPTEATVTTTVYDPPWWRPTEPGDMPTIGRPIANSRVWILDANLRPVPIGVPGELHIGGLGLARGYLNRPELTAEKFIPDPFGDAPGGRLYRSGDLARYRPDGGIEYLGRIDQQVKVRGFRIELGEIEAALAQHPAVAESVVIARDDGRGSKQLVAYVVGADQGGPAGSELRRFLRERLPDYMLPATFVTLEALPLTPSGKLNRRGLPAPQASMLEQAADFVAPRDPVEELLAVIWTEVLGLERLGIHDNFFELGGHSLLATQVISRVREAFQVTLPLRALFEAPTVAGLAATLVANEPSPGRIAAIARLRQKLSQMSPDAIRSALRARGKVAV